MILQALCKYYDILIKENVGDLPRNGYSIGKVDFALVLSKDGELTGIIDLREISGKKIISKKMLIPEQTGRSGTNAPSYFLCDNAKYVLGIGDDEKFSSFTKFKELHKSVLKEDHPVLKFLDGWNPNNEIIVTKIEKINKKTGKTTEETEYSFNNIHIQKYKEEFNKNPNLIFKIEGEKGYVHENEEIIKDWYNKIFNNEEDIKMQCLITGNYDTIARLHTPIKGVKNAQAAGASIVSFNNDCFCSYGKEASYNAPVSRTAMFKYTTILNYMLGNPKYRLFIGDVTVVFWAEKTGVYEDLLAELFNPDVGQVSEEVNKRDDKTRNLAKDILQKYSIGLSLNKDEYNLDPNTNVHILGIAPNNARLSIAFYERNTFEYFVKRLADHYSNLDIVGKKAQIPLWVILNETLPKASKHKNGDSEENDDKNKKVSPALSKNLMNSILTESPYPVSLYNAIISRIRADKDINEVRAAIIKDYLIRKYKFYKNKEEITVSLNENSSSVPYQLGRLFAVLEKAQKEALDKTTIKATIKDRYFTSASSTPASVFPVLMKLSMHHTAKAEWGMSLEKQKGEILQKVNQFPKQLSLDEQGEFILGYYHQVQAFYTKNEKKGEDNK